MKLPRLRADSAGGLLDAKAANKLLGVLNRLGAMRVRLGGEAGSSLVKSGDDYTLQISGGDIKRALGSGANTDLVVTPNGQQPPIAAAPGGRRIIWITPGQPGQPGTVNTISSATGQAIAVTPYVAAPGGPKIISNIYQADPANGTWQPIYVVPTPPVTLDFQTKSGTATLCGQAEYCNPSIPPKKYKTITVLSSGYHYCYSSGGSCNPTAIISTDSYDYNSIATYNPNSSCALTNPSNNHYVVNTNICAYNQSGSGASFSTFLPSSIASGCFIQGTGYYSTATQTSYQNVFDGVTCFGSGGNSYIQTGNVKWSLTDEDTEDAAISRANAAIGSWTACTVVNFGDCSSYRQLRGAGVFSLSYQSAQVKATASDLVVGGSYQITIPIWSRTYGTSNPFFSNASIVISFTASASTFTSSWYDIPTTSGVQTCAADPVLMRTG